MKSEFQPYNYASMSMCLLKFVKPTISTMIFNFDSPKTKQYVIVVFALIL